MYTKQDILNNPSIILFDDSITDDLKKVAIAQNPSLINAISTKSNDLLKIAFENGYWSDEIKKVVDTFDEISVAKFLSKVDTTFLEMYLETRTSKFNEESSKVLVERFPNYYGSSLVEKSDAMEWDILKSITTMDEKTNNPLLNMNITQDKVDFLYQKFGKYAIKDIPLEFISNDICMDIVKKNSYDYPYIPFNKDIATLYTTDYNGSLPYTMKKSKYDPFYDIRMLNILTIYGDAIQYVENPTEEMLITAIKNSPISIQYVENPSDDLCILALQLDKDVANVIENKSKEVCKYLNIPYVKPSKYKKDSKYLVSMVSEGYSSCFRVYEGKDIDAILKMECIDENLKKVKNISKVKEISEDEIKILKKFGFFKTENPFFEENEIEEDED